ncbi:hypothetical protein D3C83_09010 [compost metagenome]
MVLLQDDGGPLFLRQQLHRFFHHGAELAACDEIFDRFTRLDGRRRFEGVRLIGQLRHRCPPLPPDPVAAQIQRDPVQPGRELRFALEAGQRPVGPQECFLADVAGVLLASDDAVREGIDRPFPSQDELVEAVDITPSRAMNELLVRARDLLGQRVGSGY